METGVNSAVLVTGTGEGLGGVTERQVERRRRASLDFGFRRSEDRRWVTSCVAKSMSEGSIHVFDPVCPEGELCRKSAELLVATYTECGRTSHLGHRPLPSREAVVEIVLDLADILYPGYWGRQNLHIGNVEYHVGDMIDGLHDKDGHSRSVARTCAKSAGRNALGTRI